MATEILRPNAAGDETNLSIGGFSPAPTNWESVDEAVADGITTIVFRASTSYARDLYKLQNPSVAVIINSIIIYFRIRNVHASQTAYAKPVQKSGVTVTEGAEQSQYGNAWVTKSQTYTTNPATGNPYTRGEIDNLQVGVSLKTSHGTYPAHCTQVYIEIDYTPVAGSSMAAKMMAVGVL